MWDPSRYTPVINRIETLDQRNFIRSLSILEEPLMRRVRLHGICLTFTVWINQCCTNKVAVWDRGRGCNAERVFVDCFYGTPDVDELETAFAQFVSFVRKMVVDTVLGSGIRLVDVYTANRAAKWSTVACFSPCVCTLAANGVVKDEDAISSSSGI
jgi:hypothetical protein